MKFAKEYSLFTTTLKNYMSIIISIDKSDFRIRLVVFLHTVSFFDSIWNPCTFKLRAFSQCVSNDLFTVAALFLEFCICIRNTVEDLQTDRFEYDPLLWI